MKRTGRNEWFAHATLIVVLAFGIIPLPKIVSVCGAHEPSYTSPTSSVSDPEEDLIYIYTGQPIHPEEYMDYVDITNVTVENKTSTLWCTFEILNGPPAGLTNTLLYTFMFGENNDPNDNCMNYPTHNVDTMYTIIFTKMEGWRIERTKYDSAGNWWTTETTTAGFELTPSKLGSFNISMWIPWTELDYTDVLPWKTKTETYTFPSTFPPAGDLVPDEGLSYLGTNMHHVSLPFYYQDKDYYCGPASLQMVFNYYGENISQPELASVARSIGAPSYITYTDNLRRAGHFSNLSISMGGELSSNITGYTLRQLGYAAFETQGMNLTTLRSFLNQDKPLILLMWYSSSHVSAHYRIATGYSESHVFLHDPWNKPLWGGTYGGPGTVFNNSQFLDLWSNYNNWALYVSPWTIDFSARASITPGTPFQIESTVTYPQPPPNTLFKYSASSCNASIALPANLHLVQGENQKKILGTGFLQPGNS